MQVRLTFSDERKGDHTKGVSLRLKDEWSRLAPALSLSTRDMIDGAPLTGDTLDTSRAQFKPRHHHDRCSSLPAATASLKNPGVAVASGARTTVAGLPAPPGCEGEACKGNDAYHGGTAVVADENSSSGGVSGVSVSSTGDEVSVVSRLGPSKSRNKTGAGGGQSADVNEGSGSRISGSRISGSSSGSRGSDVSGGSTGVDGEATGVEKATAVALRAALAVEKEGSSSGSRGNSKSSGGGNISSGGRPPTSRPAQKGPPATAPAPADSGGGVASLAAASAPIAVPLPPSQVGAGQEPAPAGAPPPQTGKEATELGAAPTEGDERAVRPAAFGVGRNSGTSRFFASGAGEKIAVEAASAGPDAATALLPRSNSSTATTKPRTGSLERAEEAVVVWAVEREQVGAGKGQDKPGAGVQGEDGVVKGRRDGGEGYRSDSSVPSKQAWSLWDLTKPPTIGDRFDGLDYFVSSQVRCGVLFSLGGWV